MPCSPPNSYLRLNGAHRGLDQQAILLEVEGFVISHFVYFHHMPTGVLDELVRRFSEHLVVTPDHSDVRSGDRVAHGHLSSRGPHGRQLLAVWRILRLSSTGEAIR